MGLALVLKPVAKPYFSIFAFGIAQIAMDIQPLLGLLYGWPVLHGWTHSYLGAGLIACLAYACSVCLYSPLIKIYNRYWHWRGLPRFAEAASAKRLALALGALGGTLSHVLLDSMMHWDMRPFAPFSDLNPMLACLGHDQIYQLCSLLAGIGLICWFWARRGNKADTL